MGQNKFNWGKLKQKKRTEEYICKFLFQKFHQGARQNIFIFFLRLEGHSSITFQNKLNRETFAKFSFLLFCHWFSCPCFLRVFAAQLPGFILCVCKTLHEKRVTRRLRIFFFFLLSPWTDLTKKCFDLFVLT